MFTNAVGTGHCGSRMDVMYPHPALCSKVFTVEFWAKPSSVALGGLFDATGSCPLSNFDPNNYAAGRVGWLFYLAPSGKWNFRMGLTSGYSVNLTANSGLASANTWQHIVATCDSSSVRLYANGVQIAVTTNAAAIDPGCPTRALLCALGGTPLNGDSSVVASDGTDDYWAPLVQRLNSSGNRGFDGLLDEVAFYTNALSATVVAAHYAAGANPATYGTTILADSPTGYWKFDELAFTAPDPGSLVVSGQFRNSGSRSERHQ